MASLFDQLGGEVELVEGGFQRALCVVRGEDGDDFLLDLIGHCEPPFRLGNRAGPDFQPPYRPDGAVLQD